MFNIGITHQCVKCSGDKGRQVIRSVESVLRTASGSKEPLHKTAVLGKRKHLPRLLSITHMIEGGSYEHAIAIIDPFFDGYGICRSKEMTVGPHGSHRFARWFPM